MKPLMNLILMSIIFTFQVVQLLILKQTSLPYTQAPTTSSEAQDWITGSLASGSIYDVDNLNWIY
jgi:hypothetical protein